MDRAIGVTPTELETLKTIRLSSANKRREVSGHVRVDVLADKRRNYFAAVIKKRLRMRDDTAATGSSWN
jgi:hypothetical protein